MRRMNQVAPWVLAVSGVLVIAASMQSEGCSSSEYDTENGLRGECHAGASCRSDSLSTTSATGTGGAGGTSGVGGVGGEMISDCGNKIREAGEACDDGNLADNDGCNTACVVEDCYQWEQSIDSEVSKIAAEMAGTQCGGPTEKTYCNDIGGCVDHCKDTVKNEDETEEDCGGSCAGCIGALCPSRDGMDCASGFCTDGVCCKTQCDAQCFACNLPAAQGTCTAVPAGSPDPSLACSAGQTCDGVSGCTDTKKANGQICGSNGDCASGLCVGQAPNKICKGDMGSPCTNAVECVSNLCAMGFCV